MTVAEHPEKNSTAISGLTARWGSEVSVVDDRCGGRTVSVPPSLLPAVLVWLRDEPQLRFALLADIVGIDALKLERPDRFEVVYLLRSPGDGELFIVKCSLANDPPHCPSVASLFGNADWLEREVFDMFGIIFDGHPNLRRLLNHHEFVGHPLRKDYPLDKRQPLSENDTLHDDLQRKLALKSTGGYEIEDFAYETPTTTGERDPYLVNFGPSHPIVHGILRLLLAVEGETIIMAASEIGYLHRGAEKGMESGNYHQAIPFTDRLNYASPVMNNIGYCKTIEAMMGITISEYDRLVRIVFLELNRIMDHLLCTGPHLIDLGSLTPFWYLFKVREELYAIFEKISGARLTYSCVRIGALAFPLYEGFSGEVGAALKSLESALDDVRRLIERNRIFHDRCNMVGVMSASEALSHGFTGPCLRASGVVHDLRKSRPYYGYEEFNFEIVTGSKGDTYDRFFVRILECYESAKIIRQALAKLDKLPGAAVSAADGRTSRFPRTIPPAGAFYDATEAANGELGWYVVSDGTANPYRIKVRTPSLNNYCAIEKMAEGIVIADLVAIVGSLNVIGGEIDR